MAVGLEKSKMKTCYFCKGSLGRSRIDYMARRAAQYVLIRSLPAETCRQCGEVYLNAMASRQIDAALSKAATTKLRLEIPVVNCG